MPKPARNKQRFLGAPLFIPGKGFVDNPAVFRAIDKPTILDASSAPSPTQDITRPGGALAIGQISQGASSQSSPLDTPQPTLLFRDSQGGSSLIIGHIGGQRWGGRKFTLPYGTQGIWGVREGVWLKAYTITSYANHKSVVINGGPHNGGGTVTHVLVRIEEALPFGEVSVPSGRIIVPTVSIYELSFTTNQLSPQWISTTWFQQLTFIRARADGGELTLFPFLPGHPDGTSSIRYSDVRIITTVDINGSMASGSWNTNSTWTLSYVRGIHLAAYEVNLDPTATSVYGFSAFTSGSAQPGPGGDPEGPEVGDPGGGGGGSDPDGGDPGGYVGEGPGGDDVFV